MKFDQLDSKLKARSLTPGIVAADDFSQFLEQISLRTEPPLPVIWVEEGQKFYVARCKADRAS